MANALTLEMVQRIRVLPTVSRGAPRNYGVDRRPDGSRFNTITVVLAHRWPDIPLIVGRGSDERDHSLLPLAATLVRLKSFIERLIADDIEVLDIRPGCVTVRFKLSETSVVETVRFALAQLIENRDLYNVVSAEGHISGRAVTVYEYQGEPRGGWSGQR